ncbi:PhnE/PtxC family ABC transporter permease [Thalassobacillus devorans]|uniref:PhnE/PtxC family ABC transporter permease n=1 Tax=Thalassobacillus devorans TaxID=279813 RepID=UPI000490B03F|nr:ABC transporter permease subunit [Thalassobacillus devorans]
MKHTRFKIGFVRGSLLAAFLLMITSWMYIFSVEDADFLRLFSEKNKQFTIEFLQNLAGIGVENPAFTNAESWKSAAVLSFKTLVMSVMAVGFATLGMLLTVIPAASTAASGMLTLSRTRYGWFIYGFIRLFYTVSRAVPELLWAMIIILILKPGILPGAIALALHNFGILGKLCAETVEDMDIRPVRSLASSGASKPQIFLYGIFPTILPKFISYIVYRWEVIIRTTVVVGLVGAGGLGHEFKLSMSWFHYTEVALYLICYVILVFLVDLISEGMRKIAQR